MPNDPRRSRAATGRPAGAETGGLAGGLEQLAALIVGAARTRLRRRLYWRYRRAGYRPYVDHLPDHDRD